MTTSADSIEQSSPIKKRSESLDSIEMQIGEASGKKVVTKTTTITGPGGQQQQTVTTVTRYDMPHQKDISSDSLNARTEPELLLTSTESLSSSTATTNATYRNEMAMSGSTTSCDSNTMVDATSPFPTDFYSPTSSSHTQHSSITTTVTTYSSDLLSDEDLAQFMSSTSALKKN